jgi:cobalt/nickel transport protein
VNLKNGILLAIALLIVISPLVFARGSSNERSQFIGVDGRAEALEKTLNPGYKPWAFSLFTPPSHEIESLLFGLQASAGAAVIAYGFGYYRGKRRGKETDAPNRR